MGLVRGNAHGDGAGASPAPKVEGKEDSVAEC